MHGWFGTDHRGMEGLELGESRWSGKLFILNKQTNKQKDQGMTETNIWPEPNVLEFTLPPQEMFGPFGSVWCEMALHC